MQDLSCRAKGGISTGCSFVRLRLRTVHPSVGKGDKMKREETAGILRRAVHEARPQAGLLRPGKQKGRKKNDEVELEAQCECDMD